MELAIRAARGEDVETIRALVTSAYTQYIPHIGRRPAPMDADYGALVAQGAVWLAEADAAQHASLGIIVLTDRPGALFVENLAVASEARGEGIGGALLDFAEARAQQCGCREVRLYTNAAMTENLVFYPRRGYTETHRFVDDGFHRVHYSKVVGPA